MGMPVPKQLVKVAGSPVIEHTIAVFDRSEDIDEIHILMSPGHLEEVRRLVARRRFGKVTRIAAGGDTRFDTTRRALAVLGDRDCDVLLHDAVRPLVDQRIIHDCVAALAHHEAVDVAIPSTDTVVIVDDQDGDEVISAMPDRSRVRRGQTPQGFRLDVLRRAHALAATDPGFHGTDDCGVVHQYLPGVPIHVVPGSEHNMKITHPIDIYLADRMFQVASQTAPDIAPLPDDARHLEGKTMVVFGGSYGIGAEIARLATERGARVAAFSRSTTGTHVENPEHVSQALRDTVKKYGGIDHVVNTAAVLNVAPLGELDETAVETCLRVNLLGPVHVARLALPFLNVTRGALLLFTSSSYTRGRARYSLYSAAKAATVNLTQALADEWTDMGVRINCINPERTATPMRSRAFGPEPAGSLLSASAVARTAVDVLLSSLTGQVIDVRLSDPLPATAPIAEPATATVGS